MKDIVFLSFLTVFLVCSACADKKGMSVQVEQTWNIDIRNADNQLRQRIDSIRFLPLKPHEEGLLFGVDKLVVKNGLLYLGDFRSGTISVFDKNGQQQFVLSQKGAGPTEYLEIKSFAVDEQYIYIIDNYRHKLNAYDCRNGAFAKSLDMPFVAWDVEILPDKNFIFTYIPLPGGNGPNMKQPRNKIFIADSTLHITRKMLEYGEEDYEFLASKTYFTTTPESVLFCSKASDNLFFFHNQDSVTQIRINFKHHIPEKLRKDWEAIDKGGYNFFVNPPLLHKNYLVFASPEGEIIMDYVYDTPEGRLFTNDTANADRLLLTPCASYDNTLISYLDDYSYYQELVDYGFARVGKEVEEHLQNEWPVLVFYTLK